MELRFCEVRVGVSGRVGYGGDSRRRDGLGMGVYKYSYMQGRVGTWLLDRRFCHAGRQACS